MSTKFPIINIDIPALTTDVECGLKGGFTSLSTRKGEEAEANDTNIILCNLICLNFLKNCKCTEISTETATTTKDNGSGQTQTALLNPSLLF